MSVYVTMHNPRTRELKSIKIGWSWTLLLFSQIWGLPLFFRRLNDWAALFVVLCIINIGSVVLAETDPDFLAVTGLVGLIAVGCSIYLAALGNELTAKRLLEQGWDFMNPDDAVTQHAKMRWALSA